MLTPVLHPIFQGRGFHLSPRKDRKTWFVRRNTADWNLNLLDEKNSTVGACSERTNHV
jgi:hypothetical protein